jgi:hypothetical protein
MAGLASALASVGGGPCRGPGSLSQPVKPSRRTVISQCGRNAERRKKREAIFGWDASIPAMFLFFAVGQDQFGATTNGREFTRISEERSADQVPM